MSCIRRRIEIGVDLDFFISINIIEGRDISNQLSLPKSVILL